MLRPDPQLPPKPFKPTAGDPGVVRRVLGISVPKVVLHGSKIGAPIGEVVATGVPQHVRPDTDSPATRTM